MAINYYDDAIIAKLKNWIPDASRLRVFGPDESKRLFEVKAEESSDAPVKLPIITLSRSNDLEITNAIKQSKSFDGLVVESNAQASVHMNVIPVQTVYQLDIYTKTRNEADEYIRQFLFKLINNPQIIVEIPYNNFIVKHTANLRVMNTVSDTSAIPNKIFPGQFYRWTIQMELHDGFIFSVPYKNNWKFTAIELATCEKISDPLDADVLEDHINLE